MTVIVSTHRVRTSLRGKQELQQAAVHSLAKGASNEKELIQ
jgi:hypothetical protein